MMNSIRQPCDEGVIKAHAAQLPCPETSGSWVLAATILGSSMVFIDGTVVNVALPTLQAKLNATVVDVQWVIESYALFLAALILVGGALGDHYGRRRVFIIGAGLFALASIGCGLSLDIRQLIIARAAQGVGGALLVPSSLAIISASFDEERRGQAIGTWSGMTAITTAFGPVLGGWLIEHVSWRAIFFINLPLAAAMILISLWRVPESRARGSERAGLDWFGALLATVGLGGVVYGLTESSRLGFQHPLVLVTLIGGALLLLLFLFVEARKKSRAMLPLNLFRSRNFSGANILTLLLYTAISGIFFFLPLNLIQVQGYSAMAAGAATLPFVLIMFLLSRWSGGLVKLYGPKPPLIIGPVIVALGFLLFLLPAVGGSYWTTFFPAVVVLGLGMAVSVAPLTTTVMGAVAESRAGIASGINNAVSRTAGLLAIAALGLVMVHAFNSGLDSRLTALNVTTETRSALNDERTKLAAAEIPANQTEGERAALKGAINESFVSGFRAVMLCAAFLALLSALSAWLVLENKKSKKKSSS